LVNFDPTVGAEAKKTRPALVVPIIRLQWRTVYMQLLDRSQQGEFPALVAHLFLAAEIKCFY